MNTFPKSEKLKKRKIIEELFKSGKIISTDSIKLLWIINPNDGKVPLQTGFSVSKRNFKRAVDRNRVKRLMRESFRLSKHNISSFLEQNNLQCAFVFIYTNKEILPYKTINEKINSILIRLQEVIRNQKSV